MIVMKFGGTSVKDQTAMSRVIEAVAKFRDRQPIVVLSAVAGATNGLLTVGDLAYRGKREEAEAISHKLREHHLSVARQLLTGSRISKTEAYISACFGEISNIIQGLYLLGECSFRTKDALASFGERLSTFIFAEALVEKGYPGVLVDSRELIKTDSSFTQAVVLQDVSFPLLRERLQPLLEAGQIPVLQGFIGATQDGITTTIGRGGSDYTASLVGAAVNADEIQIWTDVPGILTTDPRIVPEVYKIKTISFAEASELAYFGAKVLHPSTLLPAVIRNIPVQVCNSASIDQPGTFISANSVPSKTPVKAIACKKGITIINIYSTRMLLAHGFLLRIFEAFEKHKTVVDVVSTSEVNVSLTIDSTARLEPLLEELRQFADVEVEQDAAVICVVGDDLRNTPGVSGRIFSAVSSINVRMISQGASRINVTFLVGGNKMEEAVRALHNEFFQSPDPATFEPC
ncbi:MAG: lysine-sensitive aspartokinase 3 [Acidobacteria bacterium]|nr:MAG: lysine-sensitive aspartokinase 3 [Acidobacteriota bacterium]